MTTSTARKAPQRWSAALAGAAAVLAGVGCAELVTAVLAPSGSPLAVVGALVISLVPGWFIHVVIGLFGTADKAVLLVCLGILVLALGALAGILELARPHLGRILVVLVGAVGVIAAVTRPGASGWDAVPSVVAMVVAVIAVTWLVARLRRGTAPQSDPGAPNRRTFLAYAGGTAAVGIIAAITGQVLSAGARVASTARGIFTLPRPAVAAVPIPATASLGVPGITRLITPNADFYRIDTALLVPRIDPADWSLTVTGLVDREVTISFDELVALPLEESTTTLACVSNEVGGDLIGNATWLGYPIRKLLARAGVQPDADMVLSRSSDGFTAGTPIEALTDGRNAVLAVGMNGDPLPFEHGYPVRMVVPGLYGYVSATKWVVELKVSMFDRETAYWTGLGWSARGPIKLSSRLDVPRQGASVAAGTVAIGGVAWAQHTGIAGVQVRVDDGEWHDARLGDAISADTWRQWTWAWPAEPGRHTLTVRATDASGKVQTATVADVVPNGATGLHSIDVNVTSG